MTPTPFEVYKTYVALKMHFTSDYDYFKYNGKVKAEPTSFETRKDKYHFYKMSKRKDWFNYILSNIVSDESWIGNMLTPEGEQRHVEWSKRIQSLGKFQNFLNICAVASHIDSEAAGESDSQKVD